MEEGKDVSACDLGLKCNVVQKGPCLSVPGDSSGNVIAWILHGAIEIDSKIVTELYQKKRERIEPC